MAKRKPTTDNKTHTSEEIRDQVNAALGKNMVSIGRDCPHSNRLRRPSFITELDLATGGGLPSDGVTLIVGPDGAGKTALLYYYCAAHQQIYGERASILLAYAETKPDYFLMRKIGCKISVPTEAINDIEEERRQLGQEPLSKEERKNLQEEVGTFHITTAPTGEELLQTVLSALETRLYHIIALDSISVLTSLEEYEKDMTDREKMAARASLKTKFFNKYTRLHRLENPISTSLLLTGQVRADMGAVTYGRQYKNQDGWSAKHGNSITIMVESGEKIRSGKTADKGTVIGKFLKWETMKAKEGAQEGVKGKVPFIFHQPFEMVSMIDLNATLIEPLAKAGLLIENKSGICVKGAGGKALIEGVPTTKDLVEIFNKNPELTLSVRQILNQARSLPCLFMR